jgi:TorA maturation chaperone TorD
MAERGKDATGTEAETTTEEIDLALARSVLYRTLALGFGRPTEESLDTLASVEALQALPAAARMLDAGGGPPAPLLPVVGELLAAGPGTLGARRRAYGRLFGHAHAPVPPFETEYGPGGNHGQPQQLADIAGYYLAFGLRPAAGLDERVDHVACLCEFMDFLARKEAYLLSTPGEGDEAGEQIALVRGATRSLLRDHLGRFGRAFGTRLLRADAGGFYAALAALAVRVLERDSHRLSVALGPATLDLRPPLVEEAPMACGVPELPNTTTP